MTGLARFGRETRPSEDALRRVGERLQGAAWEVPPRRSRAPLLAGAAALSAAAALVLLAWGLRGPAAPEAGSVALQAGPEERGGIRVGEHVTLAFDGAGSLRGGPDRPVIDWSAGRLRVDVEPGRGVLLEVATDEASVRVLGTVFEVDRGPLGTTVRVQRGAVAVACTAGSLRTLRADESWTCPPTGAAGLLGRARALQTGGAEPEAVLRAAREGLVAGPSPALAVELKTVEVEALLAAGRRPEAHRAALELLAAGAGHREAAIRQLERSLRSP